MAIKVQRNHKGFACKSVEAAHRATGVAAAVVLAVAIGLASAPVLRAAGSPGPVLPDLMDADTVKAIEKGLNYLAKTQRNDGSWLNEANYGVYPSVMTSLAGIAFMGNGSTPESGPYCRTVTKAMNYILRVAESNKSDGLIAGPGSESRSMYGHGFSMLFLAQCYGVEISEKTGDRIRDTLKRAVELTAKSQSDLGAALKNAGGWTYTPGGGDEGSVTVTQLQALRACRNAGIKVPLTTIDRAVRYLKHCQNPDGGISYAASSRGSSRPPISAAAIACFYAAGKYDRAAGGATGEESEMVDRLVKYVTSTISVGDNGDYSGHYFYTHLYMAQVMYQRGGKEWRDYYRQMKQKLLSTQAPDGSWNGDGVGNCYGTSIALIILQLPYNYLPICQK